jgi:Uma2 family endonuclease
VTSLAQKLGRVATRADLDALPPHLKGEIIDGELFVQPRPRAAHANVETLIVGDLNPSYQRGRGGPDGWWILAEPGIETAESPEFWPNVADWPRERLPALPTDAPIRIVPDWICEVLSPTTRGYDLVTKRRFYARMGVQWLWYVDFEARAVTVSRLQDTRWVEIAVEGGDDKVRLEPFEAVELDLSEWWRTDTST